MRAGLYVRISRDSDGRGLGVRRQERDCRALCATRGWSVEQVLIDNDISAYRGKRRPGYESLLEALRTGAIDVVVAWHPDRLHRSPRELEDFIDVVEGARALVETVQSGTYDLSTPSGRAVARTIGAWARYESEHKAERHRAKHVELASAGQLSGGGTRPFGFEADRLTVREAEAELVREAAARILAGGTLHGVCADWNARGVATVTGTRWRSFVLRSLLLSGRIAGLRDHQGRAVAAATWPAIIDRTTHERLVALLTDPARRLNRVARRYLLTGLLYCGRPECGARLVARPKDDKRRAYVCSSGANFDGCGKIGSLAEPLEGEVVLRLTRLLDSKRYARAVQRRLGRSDDDVADAIVAAEQELEEIAKAVATHTIPASEWQVARAPVQARLEALRARVGSDARLDAAAALVGQGAALASGWASMPLDEQRAVVRTVVDRVVLVPAVKGRNFFDPKRVGVKWWV